MSPVVSISGKGVENKQNFFHTDEQPGQGDSSRLKSDDSAHDHDTLADLHRSFVAVLLEYWVLRPEEMHRLHGHWICDCGNRPRVSHCFTQSLFNQDLWVKWWRLCGWSHEIWGKWLCYVRQTPCSAVGSMWDSVSNLYHLHSAPCTNHRKNTHTHTL